MTAAPISTARNTATVDAPPSPLRIALMLESDGPGGAEVMLLRLANALRERGHHILPVGPAHGVGWLAEQFRAAGFAPETYELRIWPFDPGCVRRMRRMLVAQRIDVVHSHELAMAIYGAAATRKAGMPHIVTMHGGLRYAERARRRLPLRWALRRSYATVAVSRSTAATMEEVIPMPAGSVRVIANGVPAPTGERARVRDELGLDPDELLVIAVGNLYPVKGHAVLIRAAAVVRERAPHLRWRVAIAGRGGEEGSLRSLVAEHELESYVHLLGFRTDVPDLLAAADIYTMPSLSEGLPLALAEAMRAGLPIVASRTGGIPEVVEEGREALLVAPGDQTALAESLLELATDAGSRRHLGERARARGDAELATETMARAYESLYMEALSRRRGEVGRG